MVVMAWLARLFSGALIARPLLPGFGEPQPSRCEQNCHQTEAIFHFIATPALTLT